MKLVDVLKEVNVLNIIGPSDIEIFDISHDSREAKEGSMFICIEGYSVDGHNYIQKAIDKGAKAILINKEVEYEKDITYVMVEDTKKAMSTIAKNFFDNPSKKFDLIGITGTNGKTSTVSFIRQILGVDDKVGSIGTIEIYDGEKVIESKNTTPESLDLQRNLYNMYKNDCKYCAMEVSSHALELNRVDNVDYKVGLFTNLTQDHLDFHKNIENYKKAKEKLFYKTTSFNIFNIDDEAGEEYFKTNTNENVKNYTYAIDKEADFRAVDIKLYNDKTEYTLIYEGKKYNVSMPILGYFNVYNSLAAIATCILLGVKCEQVLERLKNLESVPGRLDYLKNDKGVDIVVDYAHTPDALLNILKSIRSLTSGKIILVFGCGGNRDSKKRPIMGKIGQDNSDKVIVTSDNPRFEDPQAIIDDILEGMDKNKQNYIAVEDREEAIRKAIKIYEQGDMIVIAGKGHENYQIKGDVKYFFDDKEIARKILNEN